MDCKQVCIKTRSTGQPSIIDRIASHKHWVSIPFHSKPFPNHIRSHSASLQSCFKYAYLYCNPIIMKIYESLHKMSPQFLATKITLSRFQTQWYKDNKNTKHGTWNSFIEITKSLTLSDKIFLIHCISLGKRNFFHFCFLWLVIVASECL